MRLYIEAHRIPLPHVLCNWWGYDRSHNGDHIFDFKAYRVRINFRLRG
jgi:hypothetical protein